LGRQPTRAERSNCGGSSRRRPRVERRRGGAVPRGRRGRWNSPLELAARLGAPLQQWSSAARHQPGALLIRKSARVVGGRRGGEAGLSLSLSLSLSGSGSEETSVPASSCRCKFGSFCCFFLAFSGGGLFLPFRKLCSKVRPREGSQQGPSGPAAEVEATANVWLASLLFGPFPPHLAFESQPSKKKNLERNGAIFFTFQLHFAV